MKIYNKFIISIFVLLVSILPTFAEKIPVKISPIQIISTHHDEVEVGDSIRFMVVKDVLLNGKLFIVQNSSVIGVVDHVRPNGWGGDSAEVDFKTFYCRDVDNHRITINYPLVINGKAEIANKARDVSDYTVTKIATFINGWFYYVSFVFRGAEIFVEPDTKIYNIFIER